MVAAVLPICSLFLSLAVLHIIYPAIFILFFAAVSVVAWNSGFLPAMFAAVESAVFANYFLLVTEGRWLHDTRSVLRTALFLLSCALISFLGEKQLRAQRLLRRMHAELATEHERLTLALSASKAFAWFHDAKKHTVTVRGNLEVVEAVGSPVSSDDWMAAIHPEDQNRVREAFSIALCSGTPYELEYRVAIGENVYWLLSHGKGIKLQDGKLIGVVGVTVDITKEKRMQSVLARSERFAVAGRLAATVAHEIRNPLETIGNVVYLLRGSEDVSARTAEMLEVVAKEVENLGNISRNTLTLHRDSKDASRFSVSDAADLVLEFYRKKAEQKNVQLQRSHWSANTSMNGFSGEVRQVLSNLVGNALDAVDESGIIAVRVRSFGRGSTSRVRISVADNGSGIPDTAQRSLFEPFFTTKVESGTGLGLWVTKQLVQNAGGQIKMRTATAGLHRGTTFTVVLPSMVRGEGRRSDPDAA
jgi:signal transduction histidine kinase